jgi:hypothetical protein
MTKQEIAALPRGTKLFLISRKISRSGMRQVFDVVFFHAPEKEQYHVQGEVVTISPQPLYMRLSGVEAKRFPGHAAHDINSERRAGGNFWVNGCGFNRAVDLVEDISRWATGDSDYFKCEVL